jgi:HSP20 family molecular chaperone IbpA
MSIQGGFHMKSLNGISWAKDAKITLETEVPGYDKKDVSITYKKDSLRVQTLFADYNSIEGIRVTITAENEKRGERSIEYFIDESYDVDEAKATVEHGLLTVEIGKKKAFRAKTISIN